MSDMDVNKEIKPRIPLPSFTFNTALTFKKIPNKSYKQAKNLLFVAKSSSRKVSSRQEKKIEGVLTTNSSENLSKDKFSLSEKLAEIYLEIAKKKKTRDGCFIKYNYLEELVMQEDLSYFIMKVYPTKLFLYFKNPYKVKYFYHTTVDEESDLFDSIDKEEIPARIFDEIMLCENWFLMYDYHCFLQIQKYAYEDECAQPIFSEFVLLKPTTKLLIELVKKSAYETNNNNGSSHEELTQKYESKIYFDISGPLYLDIHPAAQELMNLLKIYQSPFGYTSLKYALAERPVVYRQSEINPYKEELLKILEERIPQPSNSSKDMDFEFSGSIFDYETWKEELQSFLDQRYIGVNPDEICQPTTFVELFELTTENFTGNDCSVSELMKTYLSVFWKNGMFYSCLTLEKYIYDPDIPSDFLSLIGKRKELDRYIFKVAEGLSCRYNKDLNIYYKNMITNRSLALFFPIPEPESFNPEAFTRYRDDSTNKKARDSKYDERKSVSGHSSNLKKSLFIQSDSDSDEEENGFNLYKNLSSYSSILQDSFNGEEEIDDLLKYTLGHSSNLKGSYTEDEEIDNLFKSAQGHLSYAKVLKTENVEIDNLFKSTPDPSSCVEVYLDHEDNSDMDCHITDILNSSLLEDIFSKTESKETPQTGDHQSSAFGTDRFKEEEKPNFNAVFIKHKKWNIESYPPLNAKFEFNKEDFIKGINHKHGERLQWLISKLLPRNEDYL